MHFSPALQLLNIIPQQPDHLTFVSSQISGNSNVVSSTASSIFQAISFTSLPQISQTSNLEMENEKLSIPQQISQSLIAFSQQFPEQISIKSSEGLGKVISGQQELTPETMFTLWSFKFCVIFQTGYQGYHATVLLWGKWLVLCDRARGGFVTYRINSDSMSLDVIKQMISLKNQDERENGKGKYEHFFFDDMPKSWCQTKDKYCDWLEQTMISEYPFGDGTWANTEAVVLPYLILTGVKERQKMMSGHRLNLEDLKTIQSQKTEVYINWQNFHLARGKKLYKEKTFFVCR